MEESASERFVVFYGGVTEGPLDVTDHWPLGKAPKHVQLGPHEPTNPDRPVERYVLRPERSEHNWLVYDRYLPLRHGDWPTGSVPIVDLPPR
jgi:hypothetical protein